MIFDTDLVRKEDAFTTHPEIDVGHNGSYHFGGNLPTVFKPGFKSTTLQEIPNQNIACDVANTYMRAAPINQSKQPSVWDFTNAEISSN
jgi:hypothetical protein